MTPASPPAKLKLIYESAEQKYLRSLPPEHFMEATAQGTQRKITLHAFDYVREYRPEVQCFNELLLQYPRADERRPGQVVPDNMVVVHPEPIVANGSYNLPLQPVGPLLVLEYVSKSNARKDYEDNMTKYEREVRVPYYLLFYPDNQELTLFRHTGERLAAVPPDARERRPIPELELEVGLLDGWLRFWFRGELVPLTGDLVGQRDTARQETAAERAARQAAEAARQAAEAARQAAEAARQTAEAARQTAEARATAAEAELTRLRALLAKSGGNGAG